MLLYFIQFLSYFHEKNYLIQQVSFFQDDSQQSRFMWFSCEIPSRKKNALQAKQNKVYSVLVDCSVCPLANANKNES